MSDNDKQTYQEQKEAAIKARITRSQSPAELIQVQQNIIVELVKESASLQAHAEAYREIMADQSDMHWTDDLGFRCGTCSGTFSQHEFSHG